MFKLCGGLADPEILWGGRQCISLVVIYDNCTQRTGKGSLLQKNLVANREGGVRPHL